MPVMMEDRFREFAGVDAVKTVHVDRNHRGTVWHRAKGIAFNATGPAKQMSYFSCI